MLIFFLIILTITIEFVVIDNVVDNVAIVSFRVIRFSFVFSRNFYKWFMTEERERDTCYCLHQTVEIEDHVVNIINISPEFIIRSWSPDDPALHRWIWSINSFLDIRRSDTLPHSFDLKYVAESRSVWFSDSDSFSVGITIGAPQE